MTAGSKGRSNVVNLEKSLPTASAWQVVCDMEDDVSAVGRFADALLIMCSEIEEEEDAQTALAFYQIVHTMKGHIRRIEERRGTLFHALHPNREVAS